MSRTGLPGAGIWARSARSVAATGGVFILLALSGCSLAGDIQPPPGYSTAQAAEPVAAEDIFPLMPPDPARGAPIYAAKCAPCHGETGMGNGGLAEQLPVSPTALGDPNVNRQARPIDWFNVISAGRMSRSMPPFAASLSERQRWDLVAYLLVMGAGEDNLAQGRALYAAQCQECHGENGRGDGPRAAGLDGSVPNWSNPARLAQLSADEIWQAITQGAGSDMPTYAEALGPEERRSLAAYVRALSFTPAFRQPHDDQAARSQGAAPVTEAQSPAAEAETAGIRVVVSNGSGGRAPAGMQVTLQGFDQMQPAAQYTCKLQPDQTCTFAGVELAAQRIYVAWAEYNGLRFLSEMIEAPSISAGQQTQLPLYIYETTADAAQLTAQRVHIFLEFPEPGTLRVAELFLIHNAGRRVVVARESGGAVLTFKLPPGAANLQFENGELGDRFIGAPGGFGDTASILPGDNPQQVLFAYDLPYSRQTELSVEMPLPVRTAMVVLPEQEGVRLQSEQLREMGQQSVQGMNIRLYGASNLTAGQVLQMTIQGRPHSAPLVSRGSLAGLLFGGGVFFAVLGFAGLWLYRRRLETRRQAAIAGGPAMQQQSLDELLDAIVALDDLYRSGQLPLEAFRERRAELKEKLRQEHAESQEQKALPPP